MKTKIKLFLQKILGNRTYSYCLYLRQIYNKMYKKHGRIIGIFEALGKTRIYNDKVKGKEFQKLINKINLNDNLNDELFYYNIDFSKGIFSSNKIIDNMCIDYSIILDNSLEDLKEKLNTCNKDFYDNEIYVIDGIELLIDRVVEKLKKVNNKDDIIDNILKIKKNKAKTFYEALQRILFINMLMWQTGHRLNGLGRLDNILINYYDNDIKNNIMTKEEAKKLLKEFLLKLHEYYEMKSSALLGDTGQIIELGGDNIDGSYVCNDLTYIFIELMEKLKLPDPKVLVRVSKKTPRKLIEESLKCIETGIGCPLFANDDVIIDKLIKFGYTREDSYNYATSACWEPYLVGKSSDANNIMSLNFMVPFNDLFDNENINDIYDIDILMKKYKKNLKKYIESLILKLEKIHFEKDPLLSLFIDDCVKNGKDISEGGAKYNNYGLTGVGLANVVNSICNIEEFVFQKKEISIDEFNQMRKNNFNNDAKFIKKLKSSIQKYGDENEHVLKISNDIISYASNIFEGKKNYLNGKYKFGLSSPGYISDSKNISASFDGRKKGEPFSVHISTDKSNAYTELINFASKLDYNENRFNGNVVDFFVTPNFIKDNFDKFVDFLLASIKVGFFEMQMNVVSSAQLIEARKHPEKFPNLVVRVWGFSAYFKDLPDEYKDYLIERALRNESCS